MKAIPTAPKPQLFSRWYDLTEFVPQNHFLRSVKKHVDFSFVNEQIDHLYSDTGRPSIDPIVVFKMLFLIFLYQIPSERRAIDEVRCNLAYRWFLDIGLEDSLPDHCVFTRFRQRVGEEIFKNFFERIVLQCRKCGLLSEDNDFIDSTLVKANASFSSVRERVQKLYGQLDNESLKVNEKFVSTTDPDAGISSRDKGRPELTYKDHRVVDGKAEIIVQTQATSGDVSDDAKLPDLVSGRTKLLGKKPQGVVADNIYGNAENFHFLDKEEILPYIKPLSNRKYKSKYFPVSAFIYDEKRDLFICPANKQLHLSSYDAKNKRFRYHSKECKNCPLRERCTSSKNRREVSRSLYQNEVDLGNKLTKSNRGKGLLKIRQHVSESSFADAKQNHRHRRTIYRGRWKFQIQCYIVAAVQNIKKMIKACEQSARNAEILVQESVKSAIKSVVSTIMSKIFKCQRAKYRILQNSILQNV